MSENKPEEDLKKTDSENLSQEGSNKEGDENNS
jgi:hypothetical protein